MKRHVRIAIETEGRGYCHPLCQWLRPGEAPSCTLFEKPLLELKFEKFFVRADECKRSEQ